MSSVAHPSSCLYSSLDLSLLTSLRIWASPSHLVFLLAAPNHFHTIPHHPCSFCLCRVFHTQSEANPRMSPACRVTAFRKTEIKSIFKHTVVEETAPLHQVLASDRRGPWSWPLRAAQHELPEVLAPASCPCAL